MWRGLEPRLNAARDKFFLTEIDKMWSPRLGAGPRYNGRREVTDYFPPIPGCNVVLYNI